MIKEIGSEFWDVPLSDRQNGFFPSETKWFLSGRTALTYIIHDIKRKHAFQTVAMPSWCCGSMVRPFLDAGIEVSFYPVVVSKGMLVSEPRGDCDAILVMDYFGYCSAADYSDDERIVIRDVTHSLFAERKEDADYYYGSLRKWAGFLTGGFAWSDLFDDGISLEPADEGYVRLRREAQLGKERYITEKSRCRDYLRLFEDAERLLDRIKDIRSAYEGDIDAAHRMDIDGLRRKRRENAAELLRYIGEFSLISGIEEKDCPLFVPILVKKRDRLKRYLAGNGIFCPSHWPIPESCSPGERERELYEDELSIVCDQRYSIADMRRIGEKIQEFLKMDRVTDI